MKRLTAQLQEQMAEGRKLDTTIMANPKELGYGNWTRFCTLRFQFGTSSLWGGRRYPPYAFTEQGVAMLSSVLNSERAVQVNIAIMRTFVKLREMIASHKDLAKRLAALEKKYDAQFKVVFDAIRQLMEQPKTKRRRIGFLGENSKAWRNWAAHPHSVIPAEAGIHKQAASNPLNHEKSLDWLYI